jgi:hypothetical protein
MCQSWAKKSPLPFPTPSNLGTWPIMIVMASPMMKPLRTGSEMKLATKPSRTSPAIRARTPAVMARVAVSAAYVPAFPATTEPAAAAESAAVAELLVGEGAPSEQGHCSREDRPTRSCCELIGRPVGENAKRLTERVGGKQPVSMSSLLVIAGPPGAGKSTVSALVSARPSRNVLIQGDAFFRFLDQGAVTPWLPEAKDQNQVVIRASGAAAGQFVRGGYEAVFDGVLGPWWLPTFFEATELDELHYAVLLPSVERCVHNVATREGHTNDEPGTR